MWVVVTELALGAVVATDDDLRRCALVSNGDEGTPTERLLGAVCLLPTLLAPQHDRITTTDEAAERSRSFQRDLHKLRVQVVLTNVHALHRRRRDITTSRCLHLHQWHQDSTTW